jgi:hypothetical protein
VGGNAYLFEIQVPQERNQLCVRQSAGDSTGPQVDVAANILPEFGVEHNIGKLEATAGAQDAADLGERFLFLGGEAERPLVDDDIGAGIRYRKSGGVRQVHLYVVQTGAGSAGLRTVPHSFGHVDADGATARAHFARGQQEIGPGAACDIDNRLSGLNRSNGMRVCDTCKGGGAFRWQGRQLSRIVPEELGGVNGTAMKNGSLRLAW